MTFELRAVDKNKLYVAIIEQIVEGVQQGAFPPGTPLPAERLLALKFHVSRGSVREAIRVLEHAGIVDVRTGLGTVVTQEGASKASALRARAELIGDHSPLDIIVARRAVEPTVARLAAAQRHDSDVALMRRLVSEHQRLSRAGEDVLEADLSFHVAVAGACHNPVFVALLGRFVEIMHQGTWRDLKGRARASHETIYIKQHRDILASIRAGDQDAAEAGMRYHIDVIEVDVLEELE